MKRKRQKAMFTLEATIVVPTILIAIFAVLYAFQVLYQNAVLEYAVSYGSSRGAMMWDYDGSSKNFIDGTVGDKRKTNKGRPDLYFDLFGSKESEVQYIQEKTKEIVDSLTFIGGNVTVEAVYNSSFLGSSIDVSATQEINAPFRNIMVYFGNGDGMSISAQSSASLYDPDEFIRNADYIYELTKSIIDEVKGKIDAISDKTSEIDN